MAAVRCINHVPLSEGEHNLEDFLAAIPPVPAQLPQYVSGFVSHVVIHDPQQACSGVIRQVLERTAAPRHELSRSNTSASRSSAAVPAPTGPPCPGGRQ